VRLAEAPSFGKPITTYDSGSYAAQCYRSLTDELLAPPVDLTAAPPADEAKAGTESPLPAA
jgi:hypothetical protein